MLLYNVLFHVSLLIVMAQSTRIAQMKRLALTLSLVAAALFATVSSSPVRAQEPGTNTRSVTVTGTGSVSVEPDVVYLDLGVDVSNTQLLTATSEAATQIQAVLDALTEAGIAENDIRTVQYSIFRETPFGPEGGEPVYRVMNVVQITVRDVTRASELLNIAVEAGANVINGINFSVLDTKAGESEARRAALDDARTRATELAEAVGASLGQVVRIEETLSYGMPFNVGDARGMGGGAGPAISGGMQQITINVIVTFELQ
jgi:uncharacterized protein